MGDDRSGLGRRQFVSTVGVAAGVAATAGIGSTRAIAGDRAAPGAGEPLDPQVAELLGAIRPGARIDRWVVEAVHGIHMGAIAVVLRTEAGQRFQVDVLRRDTAPGASLGVASTPSMSLFVSNRGDGTTATDEEQGLGAMALRDALARHEADGAQAPALLTHRERRARHPVGSFSVLERHPA